ncbi:hypothetical protein I302_104308 [Kwoniella bestiolae CBS 10118]|uniref:Uncharacterized protein n=1 Tax=Kwoniella bestiolae CBS 10118 TaxID=1296100 RepID=A0A1B9GAX0_9TREE|nr:hypothetical protein I302_03015 [Kwoniella bestiolae CBS 10118]OCF28164.1 hypothetical protein I302_03015 [Kwoniella bestiolae CBS 10118]
MLYIDMLSASSLILEGDSDLPPSFVALQVVHTKGPAYLTYSSWYAEDITQSKAEKLRDGEFIDALSSSMVKEFDWFNKMSDSATDDWKRKRFKPLISSALSANCKKAGTMPNVRILDEDQIESLEDNPDYRWTRSINLE